MCTHLLLASKKSKLKFSWPVSSHFAILHINLWISDKCIDIEEHIALMNFMCDIAQFVVVVPVHGEYSSI